MRNPLQILEQDTQVLANHNRRYIHAVRRHLDAVISKLEGHRQAGLEDIDVGIIDDGGEGRDNLNEAVAKVSAEMLRYATSMHFHISEHVGEQGYSAAIPEYRKMLDGAVHDFVLVSERIYPKDDGLRTIKGILAVLKTIHQVGEVNAWRISDALKMTTGSDFAAKAASARSPQAQGRAPCFPIASHRVWELCYSGTMLVYLDTSLPAP